MLGVTALTLLLATAVSARPEPPVGQYLPPDQQYGPPRRNGFGVGGQSSQNGPGGTFGNNQYLPPNQQYGAPGGAFGGYNDGYNETPAKYEFEYMVNDIESENDFGHKESRDGDVARGVYYVLLPDGRRQTVEYVADQNGFRPIITYMQEGTGIGNGYRNDGTGYPSGNNGYRY
ncbi:pro-resilin-like [Chelonus insularis]|uniref:pro-resilin-like n=1 Tax=Chelonus insularis TaxID=460826 RepID=UPI00158923B8|nr:pro-resilin-like [Chelonus insularis]